jgi:hypothetical protein
MFRLAQDGMGSVYSGFGLGFYGGLGCVFDDGNGGLSLARLWRIGSLGIWVFKKGLLA